MHAPDIVHADHAEGPVRLDGSQILFLIVIVLLLTVDGVDMQILSVTVSAISEQWGLPLSAFGMAMAAGHLGAAIGATAGGMLADRIGRRTTILLGVLWFSLFTLATLMARTTGEIAFARLVAGLGLGGCLPPALALVSETLPARLRAVGVSLCILANPLGIAAAGGCAALAIPRFGWESMYILFGLIPLLIAVIGYFGLPESPAFLARAAERQGGGGASASSQPAKATPRALFKGEHRRLTISIFIAFFSAYLALTLVLNWMPSLLKSGGFSVEIASSALSTFSLAGIAATLHAGLLMSAHDTRRVAMGFTAGAILMVMTIVVALPTSPASVEASGGYIFFYGIIAAAGFMFNGAMTSLYAHAAGSFDPAVRATGVGFSATCGRVGAIVGAFIGARVFEMFGTSTFFMLMMGMIALTFIALFLSGGAALARTPASKARPERMTPSIQDRR
ncbi:hypothetical protein CAF53_18635 [Sphingobium sp. LB126]|uniref:MFS transporter n=1 Tax=Sphingobium sp. LB126 TaxID=1983755 RepID=UPI000C1FF2B8|nr:MFS transporter [Sphingobium sp. LB126]PJG46222.1 hypothetical protein CAF53_18635 [Sphingobium sp. LB126]